MNIDAIATLDQHLPEVFNQSKLERLPEDVHTPEASIADADLNNVESAILDSLDLDSGIGRAAGEVGDDSPALISSLDADVSLEDIWSSVIAPQSGAWDSVVERIRGRDGFPGAPQRPKGGHPPPPDALAFYLPFHRFPVSIWGIYLTAEGVAYLTSQFYSMARGFLSPAEAMRLARAFLFHHEAYHNAVEAFATRLECTHRQRVYEKGVQTVYLNSPPEEHEEALATAYAIGKATAALPIAKRKFALRLLRVYVQACESPYDKGAALSDSTSMMDRSERRLQEHSLQLSVPGVRSMPEALWKSASYLMRPSLNRGSRFSYFIRKDSLLGQRLGSIYFVDRRKLLEKLKRHVSGSMQAGGRHPIFVAPNGTRVPIPTGKTIPIGTASSILKALGITQSPSDFMASR